LTLEGELASICQGLLASPQEIRKKIYMNPNVPIDKQNQAEDTMGPEVDVETKEPEYNGDESL